MADQDDKIGLEGELDLTQFEGGVKRYLDAIEVMNGKTTQAAASMTESGQSGSAFGGVMGAVAGIVGGAAVAAFAAAAAGAVALGGGLAFALAEGMQGENVMATLENAIRGAGDTTSLTSGRARELADSFRNLAGGSDDVILGIETIAVRSGQVATKDFPAFIQTALDLGAVMGDNQGAAFLLARAQEDVSGAMGRVARSGVVFSAALKQQINDLQKSGDMAGAYALFIQRVSEATGGAALTNARTLSGEWNVLTGTLREGAETIGAALIPAGHQLFDTLIAPNIPLVDELATAMAGLITTMLGASETTGPITAATEALQSGLEADAGAVDSLAGKSDDAFTFGENIAIQFANGIVAGAGAVVDALTSIGNVVNEWLSPGSPPKIAPDLDKWGAAAATEWVQGWGQADFSTFGDITGEIEGFLRSLPLDQLPKEDLIPRILGSRSAVADAENQMRDLGAVSATTLDQIMAAVGTTNGDLRNYVETMFELQAANTAVAAAQAEVTAAQKEYDDAMRVADAQVQQVTDAQQDLADQVQISQLELIANDPNATALEKQRARLQIQSILAKQNQRNVSEEKKAVLDAAKTKLADAEAQKKALESQAAQFKKIVDLQGEQNKLINDQLKLLDSAAGKAAKVAAAGGIKPRLGGIGGGAGAGTGDMAEQFETPADRFQKALAKILIPLYADIRKLRAVWSEAFAAMGRALQPAIDAVNIFLLPALLSLWITITTQLVPQMIGALGSLTAFFVTQLGTTLPTLIVNVSALLTTFSTFWQQNGATIMSVLGVVVAFLITAFLGTINLVLGVITALLQLHTGHWQEAWNTILLTLGTFFNLALALVGTNLTAFLGVWQTNWELAKTILDTIWTNITTAVGMAFVLVVAAVQFGITQAEAALTAAITSFTDLGTSIVQGIITGIENAAADLASAAAAAVGRALQAARDALGNPKSPAPVTIPLGLSFSQGLAQGVLAGVDSLQAASGAALSSMLAPRTTQVSNVSTQSQVNHYHLTNQTRETNRTSSQSFAHMRAMLGGN